MGTGESNMAVDGSELIGLDQAADEDVADTVWSWTE